MGILKQNLMEREDHERSKQEDLEREGEDQASEELMNNRYHFDEKEHLHLLKDKPLTGTSSIGNILAKPLTWWAAELAAVECLESGVKIETIRQEYQEAIKSGNKKAAIDALQKKYPIFKKARFAHFEAKNEAADKGTDLHAELEKFVKWHMEIIDKPGKLNDKITPFMEWTAKNVKRFIASEANVYSENLWLGGITDCVAELNDGSYAVIDFKSSKEAYPSQFIQATLYKFQIEENGLFDSQGKFNKKLDKAITKIIVVPFGADNIVPEVRDASVYVEGSLAAVTLYRMLGMDEKLKLNN